MRTLERLFNLLVWPVVVIHKNAKKTHPHIHTIFCWL